MVVYSQKFDSIMGSILPANQTKCETYDDIHQTMKKIKEQDAVAIQVRVFLLKVCLLLLFNKSKYVARVEIS